MQPDEHQGRRLVVPGSESTSSEATATGTQLTSGGVDTSAVHQPLAAKRPVESELPEPASAPSDSPKRHKSDSSTNLQWQTLDNPETASPDLSLHEGAVDQHVPIEWKPSSNWPSHQLSQPLQVIVGGELKCFRLHRFRLQLPLLCASIRDAARKAECEPDAVRVSNAGSYQSTQELFSTLPRLPWVDDLGNTLDQAVRSAAARDASEAVRLGAATPPDPLPWPDCSADCWLNSVPTGAYHTLHDHGSTTYSAVLHATSGGAALCLQLSTLITTQSLDPIVHGQYMWPARSRTSVHAQSAVETKYAAITPEAGTVIVFPGWLPHAVPPHLPKEPRVSAAANFNLPYCPNPEYPWLFHIPVGCDDE